MQAEHIDNEEQIEIRDRDREMLMNNETGERDRIDDARLPRRRDAAALLTHAARLSFSAEFR